MDDKSIKGAFEAMSPSEEAQDRMLANILAAADGMREEAAPIPFPQQRRRRPWKVALPIAACLVLAVGVGLMAYTSGFLRDKASLSSESTAQGNASYGTEGGDTDSGTGGLNDNDNDTDASASKSPEAASEPEESMDDQRLVPALPSSLEYFIIDIPSRGTTFIINPDDPKKSLADTSRVGNKICLATAYNSDKSRSIECTVFEYAATDLSCLAIQFPKDSNYYLVLDPAKS